jgi:hypothetical protein
LKSSPHASIGVLYYINRVIIITIISYHWLERVWRSRVRKRERIYFTGWKGEIGIDDDDMRVCKKNVF